MLLMNNSLTHVRKFSLYLVASLTLICPGAFLTFKCSSGNWAALYNRCFDFWFGHLCLNFPSAMNCNSSYSIQRRSLIVNVISFSVSKDFQQIGFSSFLQVHIFGHQYILLHIAYLIAISEIFAVPCFSRIISRHFFIVCRYFWSSYAFDGYIKRQFCWICCGSFF